MALIAAGDRRAFELLYARHNVRIYRFVLRLSKSAELAEDIMIEVFLAAWRTAHQFRSACQVSTWLLSIARRRAISALRRQSEKQLSGDEALIVDDANDLETVTSRSIRHSIIQKCLRQLPLAQAEIIELVYYQEKSIREVAQILGIPEGTVKTRMFYARARLAVLLEAAGICNSQA
jgi:RNA polymerase sigma-70 factor (ECF subfamily)